MRFPHLTLATLSLVALANSASAASSTTTSELSVDLAGDYDEMTDVLVTFHDAKGAVIGKCTAATAAVTDGIKGAADTATVPCAPYDPFLVDPKFVLIDFDQGVEAFYVDGVQTDDSYVVEMENLTATDLEYLWDWAGYDLDELVDIDWGGLSKGGTGFFSIKKSKT